MLARLTDSELRSNTTPRTVRTHKTKEKPNSDYKIPFDIAKCLW